MVHIAKFNEKGMSLIEILFAMLLTAVIFTGLVQTSIVAMDSNIKNLLRDEAVSIAEIRMNEARNLPFDSLVSDPTTSVYTRNFRSIRNFPYNTLMTVTPVPVGGVNKQVGLSVSWSWKGGNYTHGITTLVRKR